MTGMDSAFAPMVVDRGASVEWVPPAWSKCRPFGFFKQDDGETNTRLMAGLLKAACQAVEIERTTGKPPEGWER